MLNSMMKLLWIILLMTLVGHTAEPVFYKGGDISMLTRYEKEGFKVTENGEPADTIKVMMKYGCNVFRVRKFVNPNGKEDVIQDLPYVIGLGKRIKDAGGQFLLDLHYSDTWADPGRQDVPEAWKSLTFEQLEKQVEEYTLDAMTKCKEAGCPPDLVQVGNEINTGIMNPFGAFDKDGRNWTNYGRLLRAGVRGVKRSGVPAKIIIHTSHGGKPQGVTSFIKRLKDHKVEYDYLGLSFYCEWQGALTNLEMTLKAAAEHGKPIIVVEVAYPWKGKKELLKDNTDSFLHPLTPAGQRDFLKDAIKIVRETPNGLGRGVIWWHPESVKYGDRKVWKGGSCALFDNQGEVLPALKAFAEEK